jgi:hypothetical protein
MKYFSIKIVDRKPKIYAHINGSCALALLQIEQSDGVLVELFFMSVNVWELEQYKAQWKQGIERLKNYDRSCIITNVSGDPSNPFLEVWVLFRKSNMVYVQNQLVPSVSKYIGEKIWAKFNKLPFTADMYYPYIEPRKEVLKNNEKAPFEWTFKYENNSRIKKLKELII